MRTGMRRFSELAVEGLNRSDLDCHPGSAVGLKCDVGWSV